MKYIIINSVCKTSSTGSMAYGLHTYLKGLGHESMVCYGRGQKLDEEGLVKIEESAEVNIHAGLARVFGLQGYFSNCATTKLLNILKDFKPDAVFLLNIHGYYLNENRLLNYLKEENIRTIYIMPDEYAFTGKCCYSHECTMFQTECSKCPYTKEYPKSLFLDQSTRIFRIKDKAYTGFDNIVFASPEHNIIKAKTSHLIKGHHMEIMDWGIDLENTYKIRPDTNVRLKYNIPDGKRVILSVGSFLDTRKGIKEFVMECAKRTSCDDLFFINIGFDGDEKDCPPNFLPIKYVDNQVTLSELYSCADLFVIASVADTMPLTCLISLGCGTPICCFNISGMPFLADETCATFVEEVNVESLLAGIESVSFKSKEKADICRSYALKRYSEKDFYARLYYLSKEDK